MAFKLDNYVIDKILRAIATDSNGKILYILSQLADGSIEITSESKEARDKNGTLIKKFYTGKAGTFTANNALVDFNILAANSGAGKQVATTSAPINMPCSRTVKKGVAEVTITGLDAASVQVVGQDASGNLVATYTKDTAASATAFVATGEKVTLPTDTSVANFVIKCTRAVTNGIAIVNNADNFPSTVTLTLEVLGIDPCEKDVLRKMYVVFPSFQPSPDVSISIATDAQLPYSGDLQVDYCNANGRNLYEIYVAEDDIEEE